MKFRHANVILRSIGSWLPAHLRDKIKHRIFLQIQEGQSNSIDKPAIDGSDPSKETNQDSSISSLDGQERRLSLTTEQSDEFPEIRRDGASVHLNGTSSLIAFPHQVRAGSGSGLTEITWNTGDDSDGQIYVSMDGESETLFASSPRGSKDADWIVAGSSYEFRLYASAPDNRLLNQVSVNGLKVVAPERRDLLRGLHDPPLDTLG